MAVLQRQSRHREREEADNHHPVYDAVIHPKSFIAELSLPPFMRTVPDSIHDLPEHPRQCMQAEYRQCYEQQPLHSEVYEI